MISWGQTPQLCYRLHSAACGILVCLCGTSTTFAGVSSDLVHQPNFHISVEKGTESQLETFDINFEFESTIQKDGHSVRRTVNNFTERIRVGDTVLIKNVYDNAESENSEPDGSQIKSIRFKIEGFEKGKTSDINGIVRLNYKIMDAQDGVFAEPRVIVPCGVAASIIEQMTDKQGAQRTIVLKSRVTQNSGDPVSADIVQ